MFDLNKLKEIHCNHIEKNNTKTTTKSNAVTYSTPSKQIPKTTTSVKKVSKPKIKKITPTISSDDEWASF